MSFYLARAQDAGGGDSISKVKVAVPAWENGWNGGDRLPQLACVRQVGTRGRAPCVLTNRKKNGVRIGRETGKWVPFVKKSYRS